MVGMFAKFTLFKHCGKVWQLNRSAKRLLVVSTSLDGFSLANHGRFAKFAELSPTKLSCYMIPQVLVCLNISSKGYYMLSNVVNRYKH